LPIGIAAALAAGLALTAGPTGAAGAAATSNAAPPSHRVNVLPVTSCADDGSAGTLRSVVASAADGDTVDLTELACSTITLLSGEVEINVDNLTIEGPGRDALTIDGNQAANTGYILNGRVFHHAGAGTLTIDALTVTHGLASYVYNYGGCICSDHGGVALNDVVVSECRAVLPTWAFDGQIWGGGVFAYSRLEINRSTIADNEAIAHGPYAFFSAGGGAFSFRGPLTITDSVIRGNRSESSYFPTTRDHTQASGGGVASYGGMTVSNSLITGNFTGCDTDVNYCRGAVGGGIRVNDGLTLTDSIVSGNTVQGEGRTVALGGPVFGGGIVADGGVISIARSTIVDNKVIGGAYIAYSAVYAGGIEANTADGQVHISETTVSGNSAESYAGGIWIPGGLSSIENSTISSNKAGATAGAILANRYATGLLVSNSTITFNSSSGDQGGGGIVDKIAGGVTTLQSST
jgi:hypothetical protein